MQHIETVTVPSGGSSSITFMAVGDIPSEYTDLVIKFSLRSDSSPAAGFESYLRFNASTANYSTRGLGGDGSSPGSPSNAGGTNRAFIGYPSTGTFTANTFGSGEIYIPNYRSSLAKSFSVDSVSENNATYSIQYLIAGLWNDINPITSISLFPTVGLWVQYSSASLYGVTAGSSGGVVVS